MRARAGGLVYLYLSYIASSILYYYIYIYTIIALYLILLHGSAQYLVSLSLILYLISAGEYIVLKKQNELAD